MEAYLALFEPDHDAGGYVVTFPDFGYGVTQGETGEEAMEMARDLLMLTIGDYIAESKRRSRAVSAYPKLTSNVCFRCGTTPVWTRLKRDLRRLVNAFTSKPATLPESRRMALHN